MFGRRSFSLFLLLVAGAEAFYKASWTFGRSALRLQTRVNSLSSRFNAPFPLSLRRARSLSATSSAEASGAASRPSNIESHTLFSFPRLSTSPDASALFIQDWARREVQHTGSAIDIKKLPNGVQFILHPIGPASLSLLAIETPRSVDFVAREALPSPEHSLHDLITFTSRNLVQSFTYTVGEMMLNGGNPNSGNNDHYTDRERERERQFASSAAAAEEGVTREKRECQAICLDDAEESETHAEANYEERGINTQMKAGSESNAESEIEAETQRETETARINEQKITLEEEEGETLPVNNDEEGRDRVIELAVSPTQTRKNRRLLDHYRALDRTHNASLQLTRERQRDVIYTTTKLPEPRPPPAENGDNLVTNELVTDEMLREKDELLREMKETDLNSLWQEAPYEEKDIVFLNKLRAEGKIPENAPLPRSMEELQREQEWMEARLARTDDGLAGESSSHNATRTIKGEKKMTSRMREREAVREKVRRSAKGERVRERADAVQRETLESLQRTEESERKSEAELVAQLDNSQNMSTNDSGSVSLFSDTAEHEHTKNNNTSTLDLLAMKSTQTTQETHAPSDTHSYTTRSLFSDTEVIRSTEREARVLCEWLLPTVSLTETEKESYAHAQNELFASLHRWADTHLLSVGVTAHRERERVLLCFGEDATLSLYFALPDKTDSLSAGVRISVVSHLHTLTPLSAPAYQALTEAVQRVEAQLTAHLQSLDLSSISLTSQQMHSEGQSQAHASIEARENEREIDARQDLLAIDKVDSIAEIEDAFRTVATQASHTDTAPTTAASSDNTHEDESESKSLSLRRRRVVSADRERRAASLGIDLETFEDAKFENAAAQELQRILRQSRGGGMLAAVREKQGLVDTIDEQEVKELEEMMMRGKENDENALPPSLLMGGNASKIETEEQRREREEALEELFQRGRAICEERLQSVMERTDELDPLLSSSTSLPLSLPLFMEKKQRESNDTLDLVDVVRSFDLAEDGGDERDDVLSQTDDENSRNSVSDEEELMNPDKDVEEVRPRKRSAEYELNVVRLEQLVQDLARSGAASSSPHTLPSDSSLSTPKKFTPLPRTQLEEAVLDAYRDVLLSDDFFIIMREKSSSFSAAEAHYRGVYNKIIAKAIDLHKEVYVLIKQESAKYLEMIRAICELCQRCRSPDKELEFLDAMDELKPQFDVSFLKFLEFAIFEEEEKTARRLLRNYEAFSIPRADANHTQALQDSLSRNRWLQVLRMVHRGVMLEFAQRYDYLMDCIHFALKIDLDIVREEFFLTTFDSLPVPDLPYLRELALNIVAYMEQQIAEEGKGELSLTLHGERRAGPNAEFIQLLFDNPNYLNAIRDMKQIFDTHLSEDILRDKLAKYQEEIVEQGMELVYRMRNPIAQREMEEVEKAAREKAMRGQESLGMFGGTSPLLK